MLSLQHPSTRLHQQFHFQLLNHTPSHKGLRDSSRPLHQKSSALPGFFTRPTGGSDFSFTGRKQLVRPLPVLYRHVYNLAFFKSEEIFKALRFIPCGHTIPLYRPVVRCEPSSKSSVPSPYKVFFHVYKPSTPFRKTAPPPPDFHIVVVE